MEMGSKLENYIEAFENLKNRVGSADVALALTQEIGKDGRVERMRGNGNSRATSSVAATPKQLGLLKHLGVSVPAGLTKAGASVLIDEARANEQ